MDHANDLVAENDNFGDDLLNVQQAHHLLWHLETASHDDYMFAGGNDGGSQVPEDVGPPDFWLDYDFLVNLLHHHLQLA